MSATLVHKSGLRQTVPTGLSWTSFFFGILVPLCRGDMVTFGVSLLVIIVTVGCGVPFVWFYLFICYNHRFLMSQVEKGWQFENMADMQRANEE